VPTVKETMGMLASSGMKHLAPFAQQALDDGYVKPTKRVFDNTKVSDHFAIIPTLQAPSGLSDAEQRLYDLVVRRFLSVFFPSAEYLVTTRISQAVGHSFRTDGKVLVKPGWLAIWGKEAEDAGRRRERQDPGAGQAGRDGAQRGGRGQGPEDPAAGALLAKPRCWAPWKAPASWWKTTNCARPCRRRAWARRPRAPPPSKA
jgi:DNA topoisomerase IA